jgi:hypothetical protein
LLMDSNLLWKDLGIWVLIQVVEVDVQILVVVD